MSVLHKRRIIILGCSGSIGSTALRNLETMREYIDIVGVSANIDYHRLMQIAKSWHVGSVCLTSNLVSPTCLDSLPAHTKRYWGTSGLTQMIQETDADILLNGIAGSPGLLPTFAAINAGMDIALANKESIIMSGDILLDKVRQAGVKIYCIDSEHSALHSLIDAYGKDSIENLVLTASGGPFREVPMELLSTVTAVKAKMHPTWKMGAKISVDSATLANKGLEVIEASYLFGFDPSSIEVVIHPQSIVHSMIRMKNGALYAQLSQPDMSLPIMSALAPKTVELQNVVKPLDFTDLSLTFSKPDNEKFPMLGYAYECLRLGGSYPIAYNATNEIAVQAFLKDRCSFMDIQKTVEEILQNSWSHKCKNLEEIIEIDATARRIATDVLVNYRFNGKRAIL